MARVAWLNKLPGYQRTPYGYEWVLLRRMPKVVVAGTLLPALLSGAARFFMTASNSAELARRLQLFDFVMIGLVVFVWMLALTVVMGCVVVWLMKGPAFVADAYEVSHSDEPKR